MDNATVSTRVRIAAQLLAVTLLIVAATALPWVKYHVRGAGTIHSLGAGPYAGILIAAALVAGAFSLFQLAARSRWPSYLAAAGGTAAILLSAVTGATRMSHANDLTATAGGTTTWAWGTVGAVLAGAALAAFSLIHRGDDATSNHEG